MQQAFPIFLVIGLLMASPAGADEPKPGNLDVDRIVRSHPDMPERGASMKTVRATLGEPDEIKKGVGDPPITRWVYDDFTVFFEHDRVLHSVRPRSTSD